MPYKSDRFWRATRCDLASGLFAMLANRAATMGEVCNVEARQETIRSLARATSVVRYHELAGTKTNYMRRRTAEQAKGALSQSHDTV
jgi:hypothetical protein